MRTIGLVGLLVIPALLSAGDTIRTQAGGLRFSLPAAWTRVPAASDVRQAQYRLPRAPGDTDDGELALFHFGPSQGGGVQQNLDRWYAQFAQPEGRSSKDAATVTTRTTGDLKVTTVDLGGTFLGGPGQPVSKPNYRMLAAVVEGNGGPWFFKATGPDRTIAAARPGFDALLESLDAHR